MVEAPATLEASLHARKPVSVRVLTGSMAPTVLAGATVTARAGKPALGDVVLVRSPDGFTLHRLIARLGPRWVHAGDAPGSGAGLCRARDVLAVAELPRRVPGRRARALAILDALARSVRSRLRV